MIDYARITVKAGDGGNGAGSFHKIKGKRYGKADGGDGGSGGNVYIEATGDLNTLEKYRFVKDYKAQSGANGLSQLRRGAQGEDLVLKVPVGTLIKVTELQRAKGDKEDLNISVSSGSLSSMSLFDMVEPGQKVLVARGGLGGRGNAHLRNEFGRRPRVGETGQEGEQVNLTLELKLIADVGLIGLPNAGKSTLLAKLTSAKPKIAPYPFTTLEPNLGVLRIEDRVKRTELRKNNSANDYSLNSKPYSLILADIPGLISGASQGRGLGDLFLRHIERTRILVHLVDVSSNQLWEDYQTVRGELKVYSSKSFAYSLDLAKKKEIVALTKIDLVDKKTVEAALATFKKKRKRIVAISAQSGEGLGELVQSISRIVLVKS